MSSIPTAAPIPYPYPPNPTVAVTAPPARPAAPTVAFDQFVSAAPLPAPQVSLAWRLRRVPGQDALAHFPDVPGEPPELRLQLYKALYQSANSTGRKQLTRLMKQGVLQDTSSDDGHTTLYHLYKTLNQQPGAGFVSNRLMHIVLKLLDRPYALTQKPATLLDPYADRLLAIDGSATSQQRGLKQVYAPKPHTKKDINIRKSYDCAAAATMYGMMDRQPSEFVRQVNGLTSPQRQFTKRVRLADMLPGDPAGSMQILQQAGIPFRPDRPGEVVITVKAPAQVTLRALSDYEKVRSGVIVRDAVQTLYQMTLIKLGAGKGFDEADDTMMNPDGSDAGVGLPGDQIDLMSTLIEGQGGTESVTVQVVNGKANPGPGEDPNRAFLYGYSLPFEQTQALLLKSLKMGKMPMIGIMYNDEDGGFLGGHYLRLTGATQDPNTQELNFVAVDSDDDNPLPVTMSARSLIPMINRIHLPVSVARPINEQLMASEQYFLPDISDAQQFDLVGVHHGPMPADPAPIAPPPPASQPA
jgi:hypothetical protein